MGFVSDLSPAEAGQKTIFFRLESKARDIFGYACLPCTNVLLELTGGQVHDGVMMQNCLEQPDISGSTVLADKAYGSWENR